MSVTVRDFPSVRQRLIELDLHAAGDFLLIPRGFEIASTSQDLFHKSSATTVAKLFSQAGLSTGIVQPPSQRLPIIQENNITWAGPTLFIAFSLASSDPAAVTLGLNVLGNYITEFFRGTV